MAEIRYVATDTTPLYVDATGSKRRAVLLWGDRVRVETGQGARRRARARGVTGFVDPDALGDTSLLELYFIDVGQGDGVLIRTPDGRHVMVDGGYRRSGQPTGKNAADFVDWKFAQDYEADRIHLDAMIVSHCDADHYGGLWDLLNPRETRDLDLTDVRVDAFYHAGVGWWQETDGKRTLGPKEDGYLTRLMGDRADLGSSIGPGFPRLQGEWGAFLSDVFAHGCPITRLSSATQHLEGFGPQDGSVVINILGPVEFVENGEPRLRSLGGDSQNTNGNSIVLRLDYGRARFLLTGDLNLAAQQALLEDYVGERQAFAGDVVKGCHHGSDDCSYEFLSIVGAGCTVISSGDNESYAHPRPTIVAASGQTGHTRIARDQVDTPLVYSTEIARSVRLGTAVEVVATTVEEDGTESTQKFDPEQVQVVFKETRAGDLRPRTGTRALDAMKVVPGIIYGLINVRTDGEKILCASRNEKTGTWDIETFSSRF